MKEATTEPQVRTGSACREDAGIILRDLMVGTEEATIRVERIHHVRGAVINVKRCRRCGLPATFFMETLIGVESDGKHAR
jgi:hypothetical protein